MINASKVEKAAPAIVLNAAQGSGVQRAVLCEYTMPNVEGSQKQIDVETRMKMKKKKKKKKKKKFCPSKRSQVR